MRVAGIVSAAALAALSGASAFANPALARASFLRSSAFVSSNQRPLSELRRSTQTTSLAMVLEGLKAKDIDGKEVSPNARTTSKKKTSMDL
jgi:hypothetical protein